MNNGTEKRQHPAVRTAVNTQPTVTQKKIEYHCCDYIRPKGAICSKCNKEVTKVFNSK